MANEALPIMPAVASADGATQVRAIDPREAQFLTTEHWSLLATRSLSWNEAFSRSSMFLSALSAATVALALVGPATSFGQEFVVFALVVLSVTLFLGVATFVRLTQVNNEDLYWVAGMNQKPPIATITSPMMMPRLYPSFDARMPAGIDIRK